MKQQMTPWFPGTVAPARTGVYELIGRGATYAHFNARSRVWCCASDTLKHAESYAGKEHMRSYSPFPEQREGIAWQWRGFTTRQKAKK